MKQVLSLLVAFVFLQTQTWALRGGPVYTTPSAHPLGGEYAGVFAPKQTKILTNAGQTAQPITGDAGTIGVWRIAVPADGLPPAPATGGLSTGTGFLFINGALYALVISGIADPDKSRFEAVITGTSASTTANSAFGQMKATIKESLTKPLPGLTSVSTTNFNNAARLTGTAKFNSFLVFNASGGPTAIVQAEYSVSGFRQVKR